MRLVVDKSRKKHIPSSRNFIGVELDKQYFDIATKRIC